MLAIMESSSQNSVFLNDSALVFFSMLVCCMVLSCFIRRAGISSRVLRVRIPCFLASFLYRSIIALFSNSAFMRSFVLEYVSTAVGIPPTIMYVLKR